MTTKRIKVARFDGPTGHFYVGGARNIHDREGAYPHLESKVSEKILPVDVPGAILGTPEDWDQLFASRVREAAKAVGM